MNGFACFMLIFAIGIFIAGIYIYTGHKSEVLIWKGYNKNATTKDLEKIGKWTMIVGLIPLILSILGFIFDFQ